MKEHLTPDEIRHFRNLLNIEEIRRKEQLYAHLIDRLALDSWAELFTDDVVIDWRPFGYWQGRSEILGQMKSLFKDRKPYLSLHLTTNLSIEIMGPTTAKSRSYLQSVTTDAASDADPTKSLGLYELDWNKVDNDWKIERHWFRSFWPERTMPDDVADPMIYLSVGNEAPSGGSNHRNAHRE